MVFASIRAIEKTARISRQERQYFQLYSFKGSLISIKMLLHAPFERKEITRSAVNQITRNTTETFQYIGME